MTQTSGRLIDGRRRGGHFRSALDLIDGPAHRSWRRHIAPGLARASSHSPRSLRARKRNRKCNQPNCDVACRLCRLSRRRRRHECSPWRETQQADSSVRSHFRMAVARRSINQSIQEIDDPIRSDPIVDSLRAPLGVRLSWRPRRRQLKMRRTGSQTIGLIATVVCNCGRFSLLRETEMTTWMRPR